MWFSNRKNAYKVIRYIKSRDAFLLQSIYGTEFKEPSQRLIDSGYKKVKQKPKFLRG